MERSINFNEPKSTRLELKSKRATYFQNVPPNQATVVSSSTSLRNNQVGVSPIKPSGRNATNSSIELGEMKKTAVDRGMVVRSKSIRIELYS